MKKIIKNKKGKILIFFLAIVIPIAIIFLLVAVSK
jgi:hypothetical protein